MIYCIFENSKAEEYGKKRKKAGLPKGLVLYGENHSM
jgi:hypothetical protein